MPDEGWLQRVPRRVQDLELAPSVDDGGAVVYLPSGRAFRLSPLAARVLSLVDGVRTVATIAEELSLSTAEQRRQLRDTLDREFRATGLVLFEHDPPLSHPRRSVLWARWILVPASGVAVGSRWGAGLYRRPVAVPLLLLAAAANIWFLAAYPWPQGMNWDPRAWTPAIAFLFLSGLWHEFGHASALRARGERPGGIGVGMYWFYPVMFCDVTRAWKLPGRTRLMVDAGGIYFHFLLTGILAAFAGFTGSWSAGSLLVAIYLSILANLNPFFRMDGYWMVADLSGVDDLRGDARSVWRSWIRRSHGQGAWRVRLYAALSALYFAGIGVWLVVRFLPQWIAATMSYVDAGRQGEFSGGVVWAVLLGVLVAVGAVLLLIRGLDAVRDVLLTPTATGREKAS